MVYEHLELTVANAVAHLTLNRPRQLNALNAGLLRELKAAVSEVAADTTARALVITGRGRAFCAGADLDSLQSGMEGYVSRYATLGDAVAADLYENHNRILQTLWNMPKPVITAINGVAAGGGLGLALTADITLAAKSASFVCVFGPRLGVVPDMGTTFHLQRLVGRARALGMAMTAERISAAQAADWGLVYRVVEDDVLAQAAADMAAELTKGPPLVFPRIREGFAHAETASFAEQLTWEAETQRGLCATADFQEGIAAFLEKRPARFTGR